MDADDDVTIMFIAAHDHLLLGGRYLEYASDTEVSYSDDKEYLPVIFLPLIFLPLPFYPMDIIFATTSYFATTPFSM